MCVMFGINISIRTMSFYIIFDLNESSSHKSIFNKFIPWTFETLISPIKGF